MIPRLQSEEELVAAMNATHPHLDPKDQRRRLRRLQDAAGLTPAPVKATHADLAGMRIKVNADGR